ncbi:MAG TPA: DMT family transporter [archaeon]|nr:DMT family transporter [archaeon]
MLWIVLALVSAFAESLKDLFSKRKMKKVDPLVMTWAFFAFTFIILLPLIFFLQIPKLDEIFFIAISVNSILVIFSVSLYMKAIESSDLSITLPLVAFTPAFMLVVSPIILGEFPNAIGIVGILMIVFGAYFLKIKESSKGLLEPLEALFKERGPRLMFVVAFLWSITASTIKLAIQHSNTLTVLLSQLFIETILITIWLAWAGKLNFGEIKKNWKGFTLVGFLTAINELAFYNAVTLTLAPFAIAVKRLSILFGSGWGVIFFKEKDWKSRIAGVLIMIAGVAVIYVFG